MGFYSEGDGKKCKMSGEMTEENLLVPPRLLPPTLDTQFRLPSGSRDPRHAHTFSSAGGVAVGGWVQAFSRAFHEDKAAMFYKSQPVSKDVSGGVKVRPATWHGEK